MKNFLIIVAMLCVSCKKIEAQKVITIKQGHHYSNSAPSFCGNSLKYEFCFNESAIYVIDSVNQYDINKLFGFNSNGKIHTEQSARFGWRWLNDNLEICYFVHDSSKMYYGVLDTININEYYTYELKQAKDKYTFKLNNKHFEYKRKSKGISRFNYHLWPYFGGDNAAPHDITILWK